MKKIIIMISLFFILFSEASANCLIDSDSSPELKKYLINYKNILKNISNEAKSGNTNKKISPIHDFSIKLYNDVFDLSTVKEEIDFFSFNLKMTEIPIPIDRDYKKLKEENDFVKELSYFIQRNNLKDKRVSKNICNGINNCPFNQGEELGNILITSVKNNERIKEIFLKTTVGKSDFDKDTFILINKNIFFHDLEKYYGKEEIEKCNSSKKGGLFDKVKKETQKIFTNENSAKEGIKKWKEAWAMVSGINPLPKAEMEAIEKELLKKELSRQGVLSEAQESMLKNLDTFNKSGSFSLNNNFISNTFYQARNEFKNEFQGLKEEVLEDFFENYENKSNGKSNLGGKDLTITDTLKAQNTSDDIKGIKARIHNIYVEASTYSSISKYNNDNLRNKLINTHIEISNSIKKLNDTCKIAVKICNQQDSGNGDCGDCNW